MAAATAGALLPLVTPAAADEGPVPLELSTAGEVVVDEAHGRLFVSGGPQGDGIRVTDLSGTPVAHLAHRGATGLALSPDGSDLWAAVPAFGLVRLDTATLTAEHRIDLPADQCAGDLALVGSRVVYGSSCSQDGGGTGGLGVVDAVTGASYGTVTSGPSSRPLVEAGPDGRVFAADAGGRTTGLWVYDVSGSAPALVASRPAVCTDLRDLSAAPLGREVVTACGDRYEHEAWSPTLEPVGTYFSGARPVAGAWSADGSTFAAGLSSEYEPDVYVYRAGQGDSTQWVREVDFGAPTSLLVPGGLAMSRDGRRTWAVTSSSGAALALHVIDVPRPAGPVLSLTAQPTALYAGQPATLTGRLGAVTGAPLAGAALTVLRTTAGAAPTTLAPVVTGPDGTFTVVDTPPARGTWAYTVSYAADTAVASSSVLVWATDPELRLTVRADGAGAYGSVFLRYDGPTPATGRSVTVTRTGGGVAVTLPPVPVDAFGGGKFVDSPGPGTWTWTASVPASGAYLAASTSSTVTFTAPTQLTVITPTTALAGAPLAVSGVLTSAAGPVAGAAVTVRRAGCSTTAWSLPTSTTPNGSWSVTDPGPPGGVCTYVASFAGTPALAAAQGAAATTVARRSTSLSMSVVRGTGSAKKTVTVTGLLGTPTTNRSLTITAQPRDGVETALVTAGAVDAAGRLTVTHTPRTTTTYRVRFTGDDWYAPATVQQVV